MADGAVALVTGSLGLVGSAAVRRFAALGFDVIGIDNDSRGRFFGAEASTAAVRAEIEAAGVRYRHCDFDIRDRAAVDDLLRRLKDRTAVVLHAAAQPSHDWSARDPLSDFSINAMATVSLLESVRSHAPEARFLFMSTNKVYGDAPNRLPLRMGPTRFELPSGHRWSKHGIDESLSIDQSQHSLFGVSKAAADLMVQEYARRFGLFTTVFRAGCITGTGHRAVADHGFLAYLCACVARGRHYAVIGHAGLQVRDNLDVEDLTEAFARVIAAPPSSGVYNIGGGPGGTVSVREAIALAAAAAGRDAVVTEVSEPRYGDHKWWVSDTRRFEAAYPGWRPRKDATALIGALVAAQRGH